MYYPPLNPPFPVKPFPEMNKKEAQVHFDWFISQIPKRLEILKNAFEQTNGGNKDQLDLTPESLKILWPWFVPHISQVPKSQKEIEEEVNSVPEWLRKEIEEYKLSTETLALIVDIAIYFGEVFVRMFDELEWEFVTKPKKLAYVNKPVVKGFKHVLLDPDLIVHNLALRETDGTGGPNSLYDSFVAWLDDLE